MYVCMFCKVDIRFVLVSGRSVIAVLAQPVEWWLFDSQHLREMW